MNLLKCLFMIWKQQKLGKKTLPNKKKNKIVILKFPIHIANVSRNAVGVEKKHLKT